MHERPGSGTLDHGFDSLKDEQVRYRHAPGRTAYRPTQAQFDWARQVLAAASTGGVARVGDQMIDEPLLLQARAIVRRSDGPRSA